MKCPLCSNTYISVDKYLVHIEWAHKLWDHFECPFEGCRRLYHRKYILKKHIKTKHPTDNKNRQFKSQTFKEKHISVEMGLSVINDNDLYKKNESVSENVEASSNPVYESIDPSDFFNLLQISVEKFIASLYKMKINRSIIQSLIDITSEFLASGIISTIKNACKLLTQNNLNLEIVLNMLTFLEEPFNALNSEYKRMKYFESTQKLIQPIQQNLGSRVAQIRKDKIVSLHLKPSYSYFIPLGKTLKLFLEIPGVLKTILEYQNNLANKTNDILCNVVQASLWEKNYGRKVNNEIYFPLVLYYDDFEVLNPLGSHAGCYKIGSIYYTIMTIPPEYAARLENIFLALIFYSDDRGFYRNEKIFHVLIEELNILEKDGIFVNEENGSQLNIKFGLVTITGDNLALNSILGYTESFSSTYYCRVCISPKNDMMQATLENTDTVRLIQDYDKHLNERIGLKEPCIWNTLNKFHIYDNYCADIMHDLYEGIFRYDMALIIKTLINQKCFTLNELNNRIRFFTYENSEKNIAPGISETHLQNGCIILSASEMLCLMRNFRFLVGAFVSETNETWRLYLLILEITEILTSTLITNRHLDYLNNLIEVHHSLYQKLSQGNLKPKFHFVTHYKRLFLKLGPLVYLSCMRFESKHQELKNFMQNVKCRKNVPYTIAFRNQINQLYRFMSRQGFYDAIDYGPINCNFSVNTDKLSSAEFFSTSWYEINGRKYEEKSVLLLDFNDDYPIFCEISDIFVHKDDVKNVFFCSFIWHSEYFDSHFRAYKVTKTDKTDFYSIRCFDSSPTIIHTVGNDSYATLK